MMNEQEFLDTLEDVEFWDYILKVHGPSEYVRMRYGEGMLDSTEAEAQSV